MRLKAYPLYLLIEIATSLIFSAIFTASGVYQITVAGLTPLQLVLVGTTLELSVFLFEIPTGVVADVFSRRLSIVIGWMIMGTGFLLEGSIPLFPAILLAQVLWGLGYTFTSGATQAWVTDEIGEAAAGKAFLRGNQLGLVAALAGIGLGALIGSLRVNIPIQLGGLMLILMGLFLALTMPETGFKRVPNGERNSWQSMAHTFKQGLDTIRQRPALIQILSLGLIYGLYSEGYDRLWTKHILDDFALPVVGNLQPVVWIGIIRAIGLLLSVGSTEVARRKIDTNSHLGTARALFIITGLLTVSLFVFALTPWLGLALVAIWVISMTREVIGPVYTAWVNQRLDSSVRATVHSMSGQVDAIGQIAGGPLVGLIGSVFSVQAALVTSSLILTPALGLYLRMLRSQPAALTQHAENVEEIILKEDKTQ
jgi:DHA3 family tetracycline resistance protein-like MFS transporter